MYSMNYQCIYLNDLNQEEIKAFAGTNYCNIQTLKDLYKVDVTLRGDQLLIYSDNEALVSDISTMCDILINSLKNKQDIDYNFIKQSYLSLKNNEDSSWQNKVILTTNSGKPIRLKTYSQYKFSLLLDNNDIVFSIGPAGTGKTYLSVVKACKAFKNGDIKRLILTRPAVEAGESLGFLPGDLKEKIDPYLMPLYDSLNDILGSETVNKLLEKKIIEVIPLAYMRGRTLNDSFIILDEAQNTTPGQMLMFLTRLGYNSKMIINGDPSQVDLKINKSGLILAKEKLQNIDKIAFMEFNSNDVVRNPLVGKIIENYQI